MASSHVCSHADETTISADVGTSQTAPSDCSHVGGCVCHSASLLIAKSPDVLKRPSLESSIQHRNADEFGPEALPLGIDHPPQIA